MSFLLLSGCSVGTDSQHDTPKTEVEEEKSFSEAPVDKFTEILADGGLVVHYLDVGQGDATLIQLSTDENILIDAGEIDKGEAVLEYLESYHIDKIDYLIATHPHSDHIGGMATIVDNLNIGKVYMPRASHTTKTYENLLLSIKNKGLKISEARAGVSLDIGEPFIADFIAPNGRGYESINDYSAVLKLSYKDHDFLFTGDAEDISGQEILAANHNVAAQVLHVPHHGSTNSLLSEEFLKAVSPEIAVISVGKDNSYSHPHQEILDRLDKVGAYVLRTDIDSNIVITSDGHEFTINKNNLVEKLPSNHDLSTSSDDKYIGNINSKVLHLPTCQNLPSKANSIYFTSKSKAISDGYRPCGNCQP